MRFYSHLLLLFFFFFNVMGYLNLFSILFLLFRKARPALCFQFISTIFICARELTLSRAAGGGRNKDKIHWEENKKHLKLGLK